MHRSVGAIIRKDGKILMIDRKNFPFGWAGIAGHIEEGEKPKEALKREVKEEANIDVKKFKMLDDEFIEWNECSKGVKGHHWYVFEVISWVGEVKIGEEAKGSGWFSPSEVKNMDLEKVWDYWFKKLKII